MDRCALALGEQWERELGDPDSPHSHVNFHSALELDEAERFPQGHLDALQQLGCFEMLIPAAEGGRLTEPEQLVLLGRLVSRRDLTTAIAFGQTMLGSIPVWLAGTAAQKLHLAGDVRAGRLGCLALTEKAHGSDILANEVTGRPHGDGWRLNGAKWLINNAQLGGSATVLGRIERPGRAPEMALWWLHKPPAGTDGWRAHPKIRTLGIRGADISGFELCEHAAPAHSLLKGEEPALYTVLKTLQISRILCSGFSLGAVDTMFRLAFDFARKRQLYGKRVIDIPVVKARLAQSYARMLAADLTAQIVSRSIAALPGELSVLSAIAKYHVPTQAEHIGRELAVVLGARHYVRGEYPHGIFQKMMRDSQVVSLFDGSTQVNLSLIAGQLRSLGEQLAAAKSTRPTAADEALVERLVMPHHACAGWPAQQEMRLSNQGSDSVAAAFLRLDVPSGACGPAIAALHAHWQQWLRDCEQATRIERLAHDSLRVMDLAQRYVTLHSCASMALAWSFARRRESASPRLDDDVLIAYLACCLPAAGIEVSDSVNGRLVDAAAALIDTRRLLSLQDVEIAGAASR
ncbi:putative acyl-CoA dehydrogenase fadE25 [Burkholderiaceae bacterium]|nr:putative acyl-CoA dehydrogenase fadE25 [Burkholderiaceae bacterium]